MVKFYSNAIATWCSKVEVLVSWAVISKMIIHIADTPFIPVILF